MIRYAPPSSLVCHACGKLSHFNPCEDCLWYLTDMSRWAMGKLGAGNALQARVGRILKRAGEEKEGLLWQ